MVKVGFALLTFGFVAFGQTRETVVVPEGTPVRLRFAQAVSSRTAVEGDFVPLVLDEDLVVNKRVLAPSGAVAVGTVSSCHKAEMMGYHPQVILAGRRINDGMGKFIAEKTIKHMIQQGISIKEAKIIVLGLTFKENCADLRNSKVVDLIHELRDYGCRVHVHDLLADLDQLIGKEVLLIDANVGGAGNDGASVRAGGAAFKISNEGIDRDTFRYLLESCHMVTEPPECQGLQLLVTLSGQKSASGRPILINVKRAQP